MLRAAEWIEEEEDVLTLPEPAPVIVAVERGATPAPSADRYRQRRSPNWPAIAIILLVHAVLIAAIMHVRHHVQRQEEARLSVVNLSPPPPPPAQEAPPPPPSTPQVVAPPPLVQVPTPPAQIRTSPDPVPTIITPQTIASPIPPAPVSASAAPPSIVQGGDLSAQMVAGKPPRYPVESRRKREQGTVVLSLTLGLDGAVDAITIARSSGFSRLDSAALDAVRRWRWRPTIQQGQPVRVKGVVEIPFVLQTGSA